MLNSLVSYFQGVLTELRKVSWPSTPQLLQYFLSVVLGLLIATVFIGAIDYVFIHALGLIIK